MKDADHFLNTMDEVPFAKPPLEGQRFKFVSRVGGFGCAAEGKSYS
ncbi:unnamed protein product [Linum tenue]|uniref:Uncharacterized protein n=1 Tax=Linum tenue TaxID=586396 RepID=A0AAV0KTH4_9ROSI|nr:unnamed protein product [Linum tenue]